MIIDPLKLSYDIGVKDRINFDWPNAQGVVQKIEEEFQELIDSFKLSKIEQAHELGDLLFTIVQLSRHLNIDPSLALTIANQRYLDRMTELKNQVSQSNLIFENLSLGELDVFWKKAKLVLKNQEKEILKQNF